MSHIHRRAFSVNQVGVCAKAAYEQAMIDLGNPPIDNRAWESVTEDTRLRWKRNAAAALKSAGYAVPRFEEPIMPAGVGN